MIYIDPPYNTGHDFVYKDSFGDTIENYKEQAGLSGQSNADTSGRYHSDWLSMMYPRLRLARELLSNDGLIFISIDDNEQKNLISVCHEVFGESNFLATFIWEKRKTRENRKAISTRHDYIVGYCKDKERLQDALGLQPMDEEALSRYKNPDNDPRGPWTSVPAIAQGGHGTKSQFYTFVTPNGKELDPPSGSCWRMTWPKMQEAIADNRIWFGENGNNVPRIKKFLNEGKQGLTPESMLFAEKVGTNDTAKRELVALFDGVAIFETPKPVSLIKHLIELIEHGEESIYLDFFAGTSTTAEAVFEVNKEDNGKRRWILIQIPEPLNINSQAAKNGFNWLTEVGEERIRRAGNRIREKINESNKQLKLGEEPESIPDIGFRILKLDSSNFDDIPDGALYDNIVKSDRSKEDIILEMMLKWGLDLSLPMENIEIEGYPVTSIAVGELICCMDEGLTVPVLEAIAERKPKRVFFLDSVLTDTLKLNAAQIFKRAGDRLGYQIELRTV